MAHQIMVEAIEDKFAILRKDNDAYLGLVGSRYEIVQNRDAFGSLMLL